MKSLTDDILAAAELAARHGADVPTVLKQLRGLALDDFGLFLISLPNPAYPELSRMLPAMASDEVQRTWTGASGIELLKQTAVFVRTLESNVLRHTTHDLAGSTILDFGCGYGRMLRMLYYFSDPERIWGVDAWKSSLDFCRADGIHGHLAQSELVPTSLPVGDTLFEVAFSFSVFTHLPPRVATAALGAVRKHMKPGGLFIPTIRPVEFWEFRDSLRGTNIAPGLVAAHQRDGWAYSPHDGHEGETYGDVSLSLDFFDQPGWEIIGYDRSLTDWYQVLVLLRAV